MEILFCFEEKKILLGAELGNFPWEETGGGRLVDLLL